MNNAKHLKFVALIVAGLIGLLLFSCASADTYGNDRRSGTCGPNTNWVLEKGVLTISGTGEMTDFENASAPWHAYRQQIVSVVVEEGVTSIGKSAFYECENMTSVSLPNGIDSISYGSFCFCKSLTEIWIPDSVTSIGSSAFAYCSNLNSISLPEGLVLIDSFAFDNCKNLKRISIPASIREIDQWAFCRCYSLDTFIFLGREMPVVGYNAFQDVGYISVYCHEFSGVDFWSAEQGYDTIYLESAPSDLPWDLTLPEDCMLKIGANINAHAICFPAVSASEITWTSSNPKIASVKNGKITAHAIGSAVITASYGKVSDSMTITTYAEVRSFDLSENEIWMVSKTTVPLSVQNIQPEGVTGAFTYTSSDKNTVIVDAAGNLTGKVPGDAVITVTSSNGISRDCIVHVCYPVTSIEFANAETEAFIGVSKALTAKVTAGTQNFVNKLVSFASSNDSIVSVDKNGIVTAHRAGKVTITASALSGVTAKCVVVVPDLSVLELPASAKQVSADAFRSCAADVVVLPSGCESIGVCAFADCVNLVYIQIPQSVTEIAENAFAGCNQLKIICGEGSYAQKYAQSHKIPCEIR